MMDLAAIADKHRQLILDTERYIWNNPETGYKEDYLAYVDKINSSGNRIKYNKGTAEIKL